MSTSSNRGSLVARRPTDDANSNQPNLVKPPLPISHEFDLVCSQHHGSDGVDRSGWLQKVLDQNPGIKELRECVNPIARTAAFARLYLPTNRLIPHELLLALISQHLRTLGLSQSQESLHLEWGSNFDIPPQKLYSQLAFLVQRGVHRAERFWELSIPSIHALDTPKATQTALDEEISRTIGAAPNVIEDKTPILDETPGDENFIHFDPKDPTGDPVEASLNQIIYFLTTNHEKGSTSSELVRAICLTISTYASSKIWFGKLKDRMIQFLDSQPPPAAPGEKEGQTTYVIWKTEALKCVKLIGEWLKGVGNELEPQIRDSAVALVNVINERAPKFSQYTTKFFETTRTDSQQVRVKGSETPQIELDSAIAAQLWKGKFSLLSLPSIELARQLTVWSSNRYYAIKRCELLDCAWDKPRLKYRAPNVIALTLHYNRLSQWAQQEILHQSNFNARIKTMEQLIELSDHLFNMRNYYDAMGILSAFESNSIFRLKVHLSQISAASQEKLQNMQQKCVPDGNFAQLRKLYEQATSNTQPVIPYIGVLLSDLFKYYDGTATFVNNLINVRKVKGVYKMINNIEEFMRKKYSFIPIDQVQKKIEELPDIDDDQLYEASCEIEKEGATLADLKADQAAPTQTE